MKKTRSWPKPPDFDLDDDVGLLIGNRIHRIVGGQVIGQQNVRGNAVTVFGAPPKDERAKAKSASRRKKPRRPRGMTTKGH